MPIINPSVWVYRNLISASGRRFAIRISKNQLYKYGVDNPSDVIYVDDMVFPKGDWGSTGMEEFDEDGDLVPISFNFGIADQFTFSGKLGDGTVITTQNLRALNTSLTAWIINDLSIDSATGKFNTIYYLWKEWLNDDLTLNEIYYSGSIDLTKITSVPFYTEKFLTDSQFTLETKKYQTATISDVLSHLYVQDFVENTTQSDMATATREACYAGTVYRQASPAPGVDTINFPGDSTASVLEFPNLSQNGNSFLGKLGQVPGADHDLPTGYLLCAYSRDLNTDLNPFNGNVVLNDRTNVYGVKHGWQFISYLNMINKIGDLGKFIFDGSNSENPFSVYMPQYAFANNTDHYQLSKIADPYLPTVLCKSYNILFGVRPDDPLVVLNAGQDLDASNNPDNTRGGLFDWTTIIGVSGSSPLIIQIAAAPPGGTLYAGQNIYYFFAGGSTGDFGDGVGENMYVHTVIDSTHFTMEFGEGVSGHSAGSIVNNGTLGGTPIIEWASEQWYDGLQTPATFSRTETLLTLLVAICNRFGYVMEWDIKQSGTDIGKPVLILRDALNCTVTAPTKWTSEETNPKILNGSETQNINLPKVAVALTSKGDTTTIYCPRKPKVGEQVIQKEIMTRYKKWGEWNGYTKGNFINDKTKDVISQQGTCYLIYHHHLEVDINPSGYLVGANDFYYYADGVQVYNDRFNGVMFGHAANQTGGFYAPSYENYHGGSISVFSDVDLDKFNPLVSKAIIMANYLLLNKTTTIRIIRGITDDSGSTRKLLRRQKIHYMNEFGNVIYKRASKIYINEFSDDCTVHFVDAKADDTQYTNLPYVIDNGTGATGSGITGGGITGGGGTAPQVIPKHEELTGTKDGVNNTFTILKIADTTFPFVIENQIQLKEGADFTHSVISGVDTIVFASNAIPQTGDYVTAFYYPL